MSVLEASKKFYFFIYLLNSDPLKKTKFKRIQFDISKTSDSAYVELTLNNHFFDLALKRKYRLPQRLEFLDMFVQKIVPSKLDFYHFQ
ncbi:hypothetical protein EP47_14340 [Legionella norrlandica]|uniref:Uncharacterized protein n=1 Tax=Legionella norrlandica TaxID=1498499 RepID=A0A0A2STX4_9GAMM|nr:hypothetical protein EP47_14340 [Legionella norrlandica]